MQTLQNNFEQDLALPEGSVITTDGRTEEQLYQFLYESGLTTETSH